MTKATPEMSVGEIIHLHRRRMGLTLKQLSEQSGVSISYISEIERDVPDATISSLSKIFSVLGMRIKIHIEPEEPEA